MTFKKRIITNVGFTIFVTMKKYRFYFLLLLVIAVSSSCKRKEKTRWDIDATIPIAHGIINTTDLLPDSAVQTDDENVLHFVLNENLTDFNMDSLVSIPDTSFLDFYGNNFFGTVVDSGNSVFLIPIGLKETPMNISTAELKEVVAKGGEINYTLKNFLDGEIKATYELPLVTKNGATVFIEEILPPGSYSNPSVVTGTFDLTGFHFDLTGIEGDNTNIMVNDITVLANETVTVTIQDTIFKADLSFTEASVSYARGYFGEHNIEVIDTVDFSPINNIIAGNLGIGKIDVDLNVENYVGIDGQINFNSLTAVNSSEATAITLNNPELANTINLTRAFDNNGTITPTLFNLTLDEVNSNVDEFVEILPNLMQTNIDIHVNPLGDISLGNDFIYTDHPLQANLQIDLPLCVTMDNLTLVDTLDVHADIDLDAQGELLIYLVNKYPFSARLTADLLDENEENVVNLLQDEFILSGDYDSVTHHVVGKENLLRIPVSNTMINALKNGRIALRFILNSNNNNEVKFTPENSFEMKVILQAKTEISYE